MRLAPRLLLVSLVTLGLPWAGCQYLQDVERALRDGQADTLAATATAVAGLVASRPERLLIDPGRFAPDRTPSTDLYAHPLARPPDIDGFADDWGLPASAWLSVSFEDGSELRYALGEAAGSVYLLLEVDDDQVVYGTAENGDAVLLRFGDPRAGRRPVLLSTAAPGPLRANDDADPARRRIEANWQPTSRGYSLEVRVPATYTMDRFGFLVYDRDGDAAARTAGSLADAVADPGWLVWRRSTIDRDLARAVGPGIRVRLLDPVGFVLADAGTTGRGPGDTDTLSRRLLRLAVGDDLPSRPPPRSAPGWLDPGGWSVTDPDETAVERFRSPTAGRMVVTAARPLAMTPTRNGLLVAEQDLDAILSLTDRAAFRLFGASFAVGLLAAILLLAFAAWLSLRIRRLSGAASQGTATGEAPTVLPEADSADEIGDLSRSFSRLLGQVREYNRYLEGLRDKLTHELRTPMAVIRTSLENLRAEPAGPQSAVYLTRAQEGIERLQRMVTALGAASRMEEAIAAAEDERFDLAALVAELGEAYGSVAAPPPIACEVPASPCPIDGSPELIAQACDKLIENARDFCPPDGRIVLALECEPGMARVSVRNTGSRLPANDGDDLFDSLVSHRRDGGDTPHLGLGLFIVRLVAEHHGGRASAANLPDGVGVRFELALPRRA
jgi:signal transduction histidine kinase